jgi:processive 1,2-diacylglycerol beta-glucosyltransferase
MKRVLILSVSSGSGHLRAAEALEKVFRQQPDVSEVRHIDALIYTNKLFRDFYSRLYNELVVRAPTILGWVYRASDEPWRREKMRLMLDRLNTGPLERYIAKFKPDITVCTHFMPAEIISYLIGRGKLHSRLSIVVTDFDVHAMWLCRTFHRYFVALEESKIHLEALGLPSDHITVSGIPIDPAFAETFDKKDLLKELGLRSGIPVILISCGAMGVSPAPFVLEGLARMKTAIQAVVISGKNPELQSNLEKQAHTISHARPHISIQVMGYTKEMYKYMKVADLFIGKPGGLTTSEALACRLPMVIISPIPGQEDRNSDQLLEKGLAIKCNEYTTLAYKLDRLFDHPEQLAAMRERMKLYAHPFAAQTIVNTLLHAPALDAAVIAPQMAKLSLPASSTSSILPIFPSLWSRE